MAEVSSPQCVRVDGFSLHANSHIEAGNRERLERIARYIARPALSHERLEVAADGKIALELKTIWSDGTTQLRFTPGELIEKLATLVPIPRANLVRYFGVLAPNAAWRSMIVPRTTAISREASSEASSEAEGASTRAMANGPEALTSQSAQTNRRRGYSWAELMLRVFAIDVLACECGGRMKVIS